MVVLDLLLDEIAPVFKYVGLFLLLLLMHPCGPLRSYIPLDQLSKWWRERPTARVIYGQLDGQAAGDRKLVEVRCEGVLRWVVTLLELGFLLDLKLLLGVELDVS